MGMRRLRYQLVSRFAALGRKAGDYALSYAVSIPETAFLGRVPRDIDEAAHGLFSDLFWAFFEGGLERRRIVRERPHVEALRRIVDSAAFRDAVRVTRGNITASVSAAFEAAEAFAVGLKEAREEAARLQEKEKRSGQASGGQSQASGQGQAGGQAGDQGQSGGQAAAGQQGGQGQGQDGGQSGVQTGQAGAQGQAGGQGGQAGGSQGQSGGQVGAQGQAGGQGQTGGQGGQAGGGQGQAGGQNRAGGQGRTGGGQGGRAGGGQGGQAGGLGGGHGHSDGQGHGGGQVGSRASASGQGQGGQGRGNAAGGDAADAATEAAVEKALGRLVSKMDDIRKIAEITSAPGVRDLDDVPRGEVGVFYNPDPEAEGGGLGKGGGSRVEINPRAILQMLSNSKAHALLSDVLSELGRAERAVARARSAVKRTGVVGRVGLTGNPARALPSELGLMSQSVPDVLRAQRVQRLANGRLLGMDWGEASRRGPLVVVLDESGSMDGRKITVAKSIYGALTSAVMDDGRRVLYVGFSNRTHPIYVRTRAEYLSALASFERGGTEIVYAIFALPEYIRRWPEMDEMIDEEDIERVDIIFVTDAEDSVFEEDAREAWKGVREVAPGARMRMLIIGHGAYKETVEVFDALPGVRAVAVPDIDSGKEAFLKFITELEDTLDEPDDEEVE